ncbi:hypothetical protein ABZ897_34425 [Nonomuraea sp. NPDC046802]|uniref:hypothetical protein n=1 Tax=Nonomuraea sp. NPDC046802 TaxID=3154919 RepID=UPI0033D10354
MRPGEYHHNSQIAQGQSSRQTLDATLRDLARLQQELRHSSRIGGPGSAVYKAFGNASRAIARLERMLGEIISEMS